MNEIVLKGLWRSEDKPLINGEKSSERKKVAPKEIKITPMIVRRLECLRTAVDYPSPLLFRTWPCNKNFVGINETLIDVININSDPSGRVHEHRQWIRAGPRKAIKFDVKKVCAAIVTCGGLCPGLNNIIREITTTLIRTYNVETVYGIQYGYKGFYSHQWRKLDLAVVRDIHKTGGTILGTSRGGFDLHRIFDAILEKGVNQLYVVGGDGTHRGGNVISQEATRRGLALTVAGVPKTIDNDVAFIDRSFGFDSAVEEAVKTIGCALTEAQNVEDGIGIVKLMGRECGFVALHATVAAGDVDVCLLPEVPFALDPLFSHIKKVLDEQGHCLVVVAEGAGQEHFADVDLGKDASGNRRLPDIGCFLKEQASAWFKKRGRAVNIRYMDPSYQIRSVRTTAADSIYCSLLGSNVVHGAMAGFSGFSCGQINTRYVYMPIEDMCDPSRQVRVDTTGRMYLRMLRSTHQPSFRSDLAAVECPIMPLAATARALSCPDVYKGASRQPSEDPTDENGPSARAEGSLAGGGSPVRAPQTLGGSGSPIRSPFTLTGSGSPVRSPFTLPGSGSPIRSSGSGNPARPGSTDVTVAAKVASDSPTKPAAAAEVGKEGAAPGGGEPKPSPRKNGERRGRRQDMDCGWLQAGPYSEEDEDEDDAAAGDGAEGARRGRELERRISPQGSMSPARRHSK